MTLRSMKNNDLEMVLMWRNAPEVRENMYNNNVITMKEHLVWFQKNSNDVSIQNFIYENDDGGAIGVISFTEVDQVNGTAFWAFYIGDTSKRGAGIKMEKEALSYAFTDLGLRKLSCEVLGFNDRVIKFHQRFGFKIEGILKAQYRRNQQCHDIYRLAIFKEEWQGK